MTDHIHQDTLAGGEQDFVHVRHLLRLDLWGGTLALTDHETPLDWAGTTFQPGPQLGEIQTLANETSLQQARGSVVLSGIDQDLLDEVTGDDASYRPFFLFAALLNEKWEMHGEPFEVNRGYTGQPTAEFGDRTGRIRLPIESRFIDLSRSTEARANNSWHQRRATATENDTIFGWVERLPGRELYWGGENFEPGEDNGGGSGYGTAYPMGHGRRFQQK